MAVRRFASSSHHDPTITQKTRTILLENGDIDVVVETMIDGMRDVEQMSRTGLSDHEKRILMLEEAERNRITESGVWKVVKAKLDGEAVGWMKWGTRAAIGGLGAAGLTLLGYILKLAWKGMHA
jgi:hypothetical protein